MTCQALRQLIIAQFFLLKDSANLDLNAITYIRIVDVVGAMNTDFARRDSRGIKVNDPWPTPFPLMELSTNRSFNKYIGCIETEENNGYN